MFMTDGNKIDNVHVEHYRIMYTLYILDNVHAVHSNK